MSADFSADQPLEAIAMGVTASPDAAELIADWMLLSVKHFIFITWDSSFSAKQEGTQSSSPLQHPFQNSYKRIKYVLLSSCW